MKHLVVALFALIVVAAVSGRASAQTPLTDDFLVGSWTADFSALLADPAMTPEDRATLEAVLASAVATMVVGADHTATYHAEMMGQIEDKAGSWVLDPVAGTLTLTDATGEVDVMNVVAPDAATLVMTSADGEALTWHRAQ